jgi:hypothetical protein
MADAYAKVLSELDDAMVNCFTAELEASKVSELEAENARLKAEVGRLTKAGDAMAEIFKNEMDNEPDCVGYLQEQLFNRWNAAKEGKQSNG